MTQLKSKTQVRKLNEVKLNDVMREFEFSFWKTEEDTPDFYLFNLPNDNVPSINLISYFSIKWL